MNSIGCAPSPYFPPTPAPAPATAGVVPAYGYPPGYGYNAGMPLVGPIGPQGWSIIGAAGDPPPVVDPNAQKGVSEKAKDFLNAPTLGVKNMYWLGGAAALGLTYYGYTAGWFGKTGGGRSSSRRK